MIQGRRLYPDLMVNIYVLKLERGKYYVGMTRHTVQRLTQHWDGDGSAWTRKYEMQDLLEWYPKKRESDENKITLQVMAKYGVRNVRGGDWCKVRMTKKEIAGLEKKVRSLKKTPAKKKAKPKVAKGYCIRCGDRKKFDFQKPLCRDCYDEWAFYSNPDYEEDCCHKCGRDWGTTIDRPLCTSCWRKSR